MFSDPKGHLDMVSMVQRELPRQAEFGKWEYILILYQNGKDKEGLRTDFVQTLHNMHNRLVSLTAH